MKFRSLDQETTRQQRSLSRFEKHELQREKFRGYLANRLRANKSEIKNGGFGLFDNSDKYRHAVESKDLCDLGNSLLEAYGPTRAWVATLRNHLADNDKEEPCLHSHGESNPVQESAQEYEHSGPAQAIHGTTSVLPPYCQNIIEFNCNSGSYNSGISSTFFDNRSSRISIIRKSE